MKHVEHPFKIHRNLKKCNLGVMWAAVMGISQLEGNWPTFFEEKSWQDRGISPCLRSRRESGTGWGETMSVLRLFNVYHTVQAFRFTLRFIEIVGNWFLWCIKRQNSVVFALSGFSFIKATLQCFRQYCWIPCTHCLQCILPYLVPIV